MAAENKIRRVDIMQKVLQIGAHSCISDEVLDEIVQDVNELQRDFGETLDVLEIPFILGDCEVSLNAHERVLTVILASFISLTRDKIPMFLLSSFNIGNTQFKCNFDRVFFAALWVNTIILERRVLLKCIDFKNENCAIQNMIEVISELDVEKIYFNTNYDNNMKRVRVCCMVMQAYFCIKMDKINSDSKQVVMFSTLFATMTMTTLETIDLKSMASKMNIGTTSEWADIHVTSAQIMNSGEKIDMANSKYNKDGIVRIGKYFSGYKICGISQLPHFYVESFSLCIVSFLFYCCCFVICEKRFYCYYYLSCFLFCFVLFGCLVADNKCFDKRLFD